MLNRSTLLSLTALTLLLSVTPLRAQIPPPAVPRAEANEKTINYTIALTDRLRIAVFQEGDLSVISRVDARGTVNLPLVGEIKVAGRTIAAAQTIIETAYREGRFLRAPQVTINVEEYAPREISVQGEVRNPGRLSLPVESGMTLLDAITRAGGFTDTAKGNAVNVTRVLDDGSKKVYTLDVQSLIRGRSNAVVDETTLLLLPGDIVYVPQRLF